MTAQPSTVSPPPTDGAVGPDRRSRWLRASGVAGVAVCLALGTPALTAQAATSYTRTSLSATVTGTSVAVTTTLKASTSTSASVLKVCVRTASNANVDFPAQSNVTIRPSGTTYTGTRTFSPGSYSYFSCLQVGSQWYSVDAPKTFTVPSTPAPSTPAPTTPAPTTPAPTTPAPTTPAPTTPVPTTPVPTTPVPTTPVPTTPVPTTPAPSPTTPASSTSMPTTSSRAGWAYSYGEDFTRSAPTGSFASVYGWNWSGYRGERNDTSRNGSYQPDKVLSVSDGKLDMKLGYDAGTGLFNVAAPFPQPPAGVNGGSADYKGMRTSVRFKSSGSMPGYKVAWMLWPSTWNWNDGEIDFPESSLDNTIYGFAHEAGTGNPSNNTMWAKSAASFTDGWHVATTEWIPGVSVEFFLDGVSIGKTTSHVPTVPMHWTLQTETELSSTAPAKTVSGTISIDWLTVESWKG